MMFLDPGPSYLEWIGTSKNVTYLFSLKYRMVPIYKPWKGHLEGEQPHLGHLRSPWLWTTY